MDPDTFLAQDDVHLLVQAMNTFALEVDAADARKDTLVNAGIHHAFRSKLTFETSSHLFANKLVARFREYRVSQQRPAYHPMVSLLDYLLKGHELEDQDRNLFKKLVKQGLENFAGLTALSAVGRIEAPPGTAMGTGVLVGRQLLLTCKHVVERISDNGLDRAWARFGYKTGRYGVETGEVFELDLKTITNYNSQSGDAFDYILVEIVGKPEYRVAPLSSDFLNTKQQVRLIHHPRGEPAQISEVGHIVQVDKDYIKHNVRTDYGSSGAPIFDLSWRVVAIHRGTLSLSRPSAPGVTEGVPLYCIWDDIKPCLSTLVA
ncbi:MAG TPA: trypsin-like peptidase domain-containing protein [Ktedonobacteraceae bacterium]|nr:trypsin-like peptidase domain-containing protein [Ktedonobacteraceae bacterium]